MSWPIVTLNDIAINIVDGPFGSSLKTSDYVDEGVPVLQGKNITGNRFKFFDVRYITEKKTESIKRSTVKVGDHLLVKIGSIGYSAIIDDLYGHDFAIIPANLAKITPNKEIIDSRYLHRYLTSDSAIRYFQKIASKTAQPALSLSKIKALEIPLPPLEEQRRIASILDQADELRQKRQQAIEKLNQLLQATFIDMFGDPVSNPKGFEVKKLSEQVDLIQIGPFGTQLHQEDYIENGIPLINPSHIKNGKIIPNHKLTVSQSKYEELTQYHLRLNDVLLGRRGEMGRCAVVTENEVGWLCGTGSLFLRPNLEKINPFFLELLLSSDSIKRYLENVSQGQTMANLNKTIVGSIPLISPSIEIQNKFFLIAEKIDKMKTELKSAKNQVNNLFSSLQNQAFNGTL